MAKLSIKASDLLKKPEVADDYPHPFLMLYEWSADTSGDDTAQAINVLARRGWLLHTMTCSPGGGFSGKQIIIYTTYRRARKAK